MCQKCLGWEGRHRAVRECIKKTISKCLWRYNVEKIVYGISVLDSFQSHSIFSLLLSWLLPLKCKLKRHSFLGIRKIHIQKRKHRKKEAAQQKTMFGCFGMGEKESVAVGELLYCLEGNLSWGRKRLFGWNFVVNFLMAYVAVWPNLETRHATHSDSGSAIRAFDFGF